MLTNLSATTVAVSYSHPTIARIMRTNIPGYRRGPHEYVSGSHFKQQVLTHHRPWLHWAHEGQQVLLQVRPARPHLSRLPHERRQRPGHRVLQGKFQLSSPCRLKLTDFQCGEIGHIARNCNKSSYGNNYGGGFQQQGGAGKTCYSCGGFGHMSRECLLPS